jgi:hypothetical protein
MGYQEPPRSSARPEQSSDRAVQHRSLLASAVRRDTRSEGQESKTCQGRIRSDRNEYQTSKRYLPLSPVSTLETFLAVSRREDFWFIAAARSEDETEIRAG